MPRANIQILLTVLQDHTPKMCFPFLPIGPFMKMVARIIPAFFSGGLFFSCGGSQLEKLASCSSQSICVSRRECGRDYKQRLWGGGGRGVDLLVHFVSTQLSLTLFSWSGITVPCTPQVWIAKTVLSRSHTLPYPVVWYLEPLHLISSRPMWRTIVAVWQMNMKKKKTKRFSSSDLSQNSNAWGTFLAKSMNKQTNKQFFSLFWLKENISFNSKGNVPFPFSVSLTETNNGNKRLEADIALFSSAALKNTKHRGTAFSTWWDCGIFRFPHFRSTSSAIGGSYVN